MRSSGQGCGGERSIATCRWGRDVKKCMTHSGGSAGKETAIEGRMSYIRHRPSRKRAGGAVPVLPPGWPVPMTPFISKTVVRTGKPGAPSDVASVPAGAGKAAALVRAGAPRYYRRTDRACGNRPCFDVTQRHRTGGRGESLPDTMGRSTPPDRGCTRGGRVFHGCAV